MEDQLGEEDGEEMETEDFSEPLNNAAPTLNVSNDAAATLNESGSEESNCFGETDSKTIYDEDDTSEGENRVRRRRRHRGRRPKQHPIPQL